MFFLLFLQLFVANKSKSHTTVGIRNKINWEKKSVVPEFQFSFKSLHTDFKLNLYLNQTDVYEIKIDPKTIVAEVIGDIEKINQFSFKPNQYQIDKLIDIMFKQNIFSSIELGTLLSFIRERNYNDYEIFKEYFQDGQKVLQA